MNVSVFFHILHKYLLFRYNVLFFLIYKEKNICVNIVEKNDIHDQNYN